MKQECFGQRNIGEGVEFARDMTKGLERGEDGFAPGPVQAPEIVLEDDWNEELGVENVLDVVVPKPAPKLEQPSVSEAETYPDAVILHTLLGRRAHWQMVSVTVDWNDNQVEGVAYSYPCDRHVYRLVLGDVGSVGVIGLNELGKMLGCWI